MGTSVLYLESTYYQTISTINLALDCPKKLTEKDNMQRQSSSEQHHHGLCMPEIINVRTDVGYTLHNKTMKNCGEPQIDVAATTAQSCNISSKHRTNDRHVFELEAYKEFKCKN